MKSQTPFSEIKGLSQPALRALSGAGFKHAEELSAVKLSDLKKLHGLGPSGLRVLQDFLKSQGTDFKV